MDLMSSEIEYEDPPRRDRPAWCQICDGFFGVDESLRILYSYAHEGCADQVHMRRVDRSGSAGSRYGQAVSQEGSVCVVCLKDVSPGQVVELMFSSCHPDCTARVEAVLVALEAPEENLRVVPVDPASPPDRHR